METMEELKGRVAKHTLFTTLFTFWISGIIAGLFFPATASDIAVIQVVGSFALPALVGLPIYGILVRKARGRTIMVVGDWWNMRRVGVAASLCNIGITAGLTVLIYWQLFGGIPR